MSECRFALALALSLTLAAVVFGAQAVVAVECVGAEPGQVVTYQGPEPVKLEYVAEAVYYYDWSAEVDGATIASGSDRVFNFTTPAVTPEEGTKTVTVSLLVTDGYGCIAQTEECVIVYAVPACGIGGPNSVCQDSPVKEFYYTGEDTTKATFEFAWSVDDKNVGSGESINIDWSPFKFGDHVLTLVVDKTYDDGKTATTTCNLDVKYLPSPDSSIALVGVEGGVRGDLKKSPK
jgi:hypothetical protein